MVVSWRLEKGGEGILLVSQRYRMNLALVGTSPSGPDRALLLIRKGRVAARQKCQL